MCSAMSILGIGLLTVGFLVSLGDKASAGDFTLHNFFVHFLKFFMLYVILMNISTIFQLMLDFTSAVFNDMNKELTGSIIANEIKGVDKDKLQNGLAAHFPEQGNPPEAGPSARPSRMPIRTAWLREGLSKWSR